MSKKISILILILILFQQLLALGGAPVKKTATKPVVKQEKILLIDNFDDADIKAAPAWWTFDRLALSFPEAKRDDNGFYYLKLSGKAENYYVGGMGTYIGKDASEYNTFVISIYGTGPNSGTLRLQLYDDDNNTYQLEQDSTYQVLKDDYLEHEIKVSWEGWRTVEIPLNKFVDMNQGVGDDVWNPNQQDGSGGLLHFQYVVLATTETGSISLAIDNIKLVKK